MKTDKPNDLRARIDAYTDEFQPSTFTEHLLVETMASAYLRMRRMMALETATLNYELSLIDDDSLSDARKMFIAYQQADRQLRVIHRAEETARRAWETSLSRLLAIRKMTKRTQFGRPKKSRNPQTLQ